MARPSRSRKICTIPRYKSFEPIDNSGDDRETVMLSLDEYEAIRLVDYLGRTHEQCAMHMGVSRTTASEIYERARYKLSDMLINGKSLMIDGGSVSVCGGATGCNEACGNPDNTGRSCVKACGKC